MKISYIMLVCMVFVASETLYAVKTKKPRTTLLTVPKTPSSTPSRENPPSPSSPQPVLANAVLHLQTNYQANDNGKLERRLTINVESPAQPSQSSH